MCKINQGLLTAPNIKERLAEGFALSPLLMNLPNRRCYTLALVLMLPATLAGAGEPPPLCGPINPMVRPVVADADEPPAPGALRLDALRAELLEDDVTRLEGEVSAWRDGRLLLADTAIYDDSQQLLTARGNLRFFSEIVDLEATSGSSNVDTGETRFEEVDYYLNVRPGRGGASHISMAPNRPSVLQGFSYTTCEPGSNDWWLRARRADLDHEEGVGTARNVSLWFMRVPIFYTPYIWFPLDDRRRTGFLIPSISNSGRTGVDIITPWYWNIAPNHDATIIPRYMHRRGEQLGIEYRFLTQTTRGTLETEYMPEDDVADRDRYRLRYRQRTSLPGAWSFMGDYTALSDPAYFNDLGSALQTNRSLLQSRFARLDYTRPQWRFQALVRDFLNTNPGGDPDVISSHLQQLPQLLVETRRPLNLYGPLEIDARGEAVRFARRGERVANRTDGEAGLTLNFSTPGWFVRPRAGWRSTYYDLVEPEEAGGDTSPDRHAPIYSLDTGLIFDRTLAPGGRNMLQTLEPRLFALYVPERDQDDIPDLDTRTRRDGFTRLFATNRFTGADRLGDARQVTAAVTSRLYDDSSGRQVLSARVGQIFYFADRNVTLDPEDDPDTRSTSDIIGETEFSWREAFRASAQVEWDPREEKVNRSLLNLQYRPRMDMLFNMGYRQRRQAPGAFFPDTEQSDVSAVVPLGRQWRAIGRWSYDLDTYRSLDTLGGLEFRSCCWGARLYVRRDVPRFGGEPDTSVMFQLQLRGLTNFGTDVDDLLNDIIPGFND